MKIAFRRETPACFTEQQFVAWREAGQGWSPLAGPCTDCTPGFQARMKVAGKCEHPEMIFDEDEDGFVYGRKPKPGANSAS